MPFAGEVFERFRRALDSICRLVPLPRRHLKECAVWQSNIVKNAGDGGPKTSSGPMAFSIT